MYSLLKVKSLQVRTHSNLAAPVHMCVSGGAQPKQS